MAVLLKNLLARSPQMRDLAVLAHLLRVCEEEDGAGEESDSLEHLLLEWKHGNFYLAEDAWVIATTRGDLVGFACVWQEEATRISTFLCVHPAYRGRGIGTLLLRMAEVRAREQMRQVDPGQQVILRGLVSSVNEGVQRLFACEGYREGKPFLRLSPVWRAEGEVWDSSAAPRKRAVDIGPGQQSQELAGSPLEGKDTLCHIRRYQVYEKELRPAICSAGTATAVLQAVGA